MERSSGMESSGTGCWCSWDVDLLCGYCRWQPATQRENSALSSHTQMGTGTSYTYKEKFHLSALQIGSIKYFILRQIYKLAQVKKKYHLFKLRTTISYFTGLKNALVFYDACRFEY